MPFRHKRVFVSLLKMLSLACVLPKRKSKYTSDTIRARFLGRRSNVVPRICIPVWVGGITANASTLFMPTGRACELTFRGDHKQCLEHTSDGDMLVHSPPVRDETLLRQEHGCATSHKRMFETLFKIGACLCIRHKRMLKHFQNWRLLAHSAQARA